ncbi:glutamate synthase subunit beta [Hydrogenimonas thermophila]|uniref:glutamate synthase subunit beta n=1 Tax=Hydrogenimonas thermophila TaxID=223786 RepID=UPI0029374645|nr:glutamate synthase subunit beta [Hydrogenimonas thermophila]WOE70900.1 glutamate synthase subunit beta [Hydrogenimonas thermophila]WOE73418.1 glutamate synthase subunit beta [Hydrogenimonas thermophila]
MQNFVFVERVDPRKRNVVERIKDFNEIYEVYNQNEASSQSERCIQCGDPYCHNKCPLHNYIPQWLKAVADKDLELAFNLSNEPSPFPEIMGRICPHDRLCEGDCTLNDGYGAITIGPVETFINEEGFKAGLKPKFADEKTGKRVAVVGAGPAGLSAATYLLRAGIDVEIFERADRPGGLLTYGIPGFKLDKNVLFRRVKWMEEAGLKIHYGVEVGKDKPFDELTRDFDAVFIGVGATKQRRPGIPNENAKGCLMAMDLLVNVQRKQFGDSYDKQVDVKDKRVVVIGGGDTAMDCVRTSLREGARSVTCLYRRDARNMPGSRKEYLNAKEEGVDFIFNASPKQVIVNNDGEVIGIEMLKTALGEPDESGRQRLKEIEGSEFRVDADVIIFALGFTPVPFEFLSANGIETNSWGGIEVDENFETSTKGVYAGGDCRRGADLVVTAVYDGREAAKAIIKNLLG